MSKDTNASTGGAALRGAARYEVRGPVAVITMDNPPINGLGAALRIGLMDGLDRALEDDTVQAIVLTGSSRAFSAGADVREFGTPNAAREPGVLYVIDAYENSPKPVIAAIGGACLGGGLELALGCHFRVALPDASIGLPEIKLGLIPGAGATQRMPRLLGLQATLNMILSGNPQPARRLAGTRLIDAIVEGDLIAGAHDFASKVIADKRPAVRVRDLKVADPHAQAYLQFARNTAAAAARGLQAPVRAVEAVAASVSMPFQAGMAAEREHFLTLMASPESRAMRHAFTAERACAYIPDVPADTPTREIRKVGVIGAGTMGGGIAMNFVNVGIPVILVERAQEALDRGLATIRRNYDVTVSRGRLSEAERDKRMALLTPSVQFEALADCDLIIEAVFEQMDVKRAVFETLDAIARPGAILATNTSTLNIDTIAGFTKRPQDVLGLHFFSPANVMKLLEVVRGAQTAKDVLATSMKLGKTIGKVAVVSGVCDGFIGNRMLAARGNAATELLDVGASPAQIDRALERFGFAMGPYRMSDLAGLDIGWQIRKRKAAEEPGKDWSAFADRLCEAGRLGQKTGAGYYRYEAGKRDALPDPKVDEMLAAWRRERGIAPRQVSDDEIVERCVLALVNEGARILDEGIALRASDIDVVYLNGYGFPRTRGGPMRYAEELGLPNVVRSLRRIARASPASAAFWTPAPLLQRQADAGKGWGS